MILLTVSGITKIKDANFVLRDINFIQKRLQKIAIAGETGSGKSTLLKIIAGLIQADSGEAFFENERVLGPEEKLMAGHKSIAYLSQHFELRNNYSVEEELSYANKLSDVEASTIYEVCRIDHLLKRKTSQLSGGEKQRIATARVLIASPKLLLLDEPFSNLDIVHKSILKSVIHDITERLQITCVMISHDPLDILSWADEILVLKDGRIVQKGSPQQIYDTPANEYVAGLFGSYNLIKPPHASAFLSLNGNATTEKDILIRPESFCLTTQKSGAIKGKVKQVRFYGSYYEIQVTVLDDLILVRSSEGSVRPGEDVFITVSASAFSKPSS